MIGSEIGMATAYALQNLRVVGIGAGIVPKIAPGCRVIGERGRAPAQ